MILQVLGAALVAAYARSTRQEVEPGFSIGQGGAHERGRGDTVLRRRDHDAIAAVIGFGATARGAVTALNAHGVHDVDVLTQRGVNAVGPALVCSSAEVKLG